MYSNVSSKIVLRREIYVSKMSALLCSLETDATVTQEVYLKGNNWRETRWRCRPTVLARPHDLIRHSPRTAEWGYWTNILQYPGGRYRPAGMIEICCNHSNSTSSSSSSVIRMISLLQTRRNNVHILMLATHARETCTRNLHHEKFDASSSQFLAPKQLSGQSRCTVRVTCRTVSVME